MLIIGSDCMADTDKREIRKKQINFLVEMYYSKFPFLQNQPLDSLKEKAVERFVDTDFNIDEISNKLLEIIEEMKNGIQNLEKINYKVDYIVSHCCPTNIQSLLSGGIYKKDYLTDYLQQISEKCEFKKWYFGHYHDNKQINSQYVLLYEDIVPLEIMNIFK